MKLSTKITFLLILLLAGLGSGCITGTSERIIKVADFPDKPEFQREIKQQNAVTSEKFYIDAGYAWTQTTYFWCPITNDTGRYVGHVGKDDKFLPMSPEEINRMAKTAQVVLPQSPSLPFWDAYGGKLVGLVILIVVILLFVGGILGD